MVPRMSHEPWAKLIYPRKGIKTSTNCVGNQTNRKSE